MLQLLVVLLAGVPRLEARLQTIQVNLVYRHGDRNAVGTFPTDLNPASAWPQGYGWLSKLGMQQHYELGGFFKARYRQLLSSSYVNTEISVQSTDVERALMSAYSNLAGLYPPTGSQVWNPCIHWQPIPVHTAPANVDILLGQATCTLYNKLFAASLGSPKAINVTQHYRSFFDALSKLSGAPVKTVLDVLLLHDTLFCEVQHGLPTPKWLRWTNITGDGTVAYNTMGSIAEFAFNLFSDTKQKQRLSIGTLVGQIISNMEAMATNASITPKMYMYSAHDATVAALLSALNVYDGKRPNYAAAAMIELQRDPASGSLYVAIFYKNGVAVRKPVSLTVPGCENPCPLSKFKLLTANVIPTNWNAECQNPACSGNSTQP